MSNTAHFGVLLPHFGAHASRDRLVDHALKIEEFGFDSAWVRDHVVYEPHSFEDSNRTHVDPLVTLSAVGAVTNRLLLGTATLIPHRHPIHTALAVGSLDFIVGPGRLVLGVGLGVAEHEFRAVGLGGVDRAELLAENVDIWRRLWTGEPVSHSGKIYSFDDVQIQPVPPPGHPRVWYCGHSYAAVRRAVEYCDGWMPARIPRFAMTRRLERLRALSAVAGRELPVIGTVPYVIPGRNRETALRRLDISEYASMLQRHFGSPPEGEAYTSVEDFDGAAIVGNAADLVEGVTKYLTLGVSHFVFDLRNSFDVWEDHLAFIGEEVLPHLR